MKSILPLLALGLCLTVPVLAEPPSPSGSGPGNAPSKEGPPPGGRMGGMGGLTKDERQEVMAARKAALDANPQLKVEQEALQKKIDAATIKADPKVAPLVAKMEEARKARENGDGPSPQGDKPGAAQTPGGSAGANHKDKPPMKPAGQ